MYQVKLSRTLAALATGMLALALLPAIASASETVCASGCGFTDIQSAINAASSGETISVGAGVYHQTIDVDKAVTIIGAGPGNTIIEPDLATINNASAFTPVGGSPNYPIVYANAQSVTIENLTVDGLDEGNSVDARFEGIAAYDDNLTVSDVHVIGISDSPPDGVQTGTGIYAVNDAGLGVSVKVTNSRIADYQKNGIAVDGNNDVSVDISGNTIVGDGPAGIGDNGIEVYDLYWEGASAPPGPVGTISDNDVTGNVCTEAGACGADLLGDTTTDDDIGGDAAGLLLGGSDGLTVSGNSLADNDIGIWSTTAAGATTTISGNTATDNLYADILAGEGSNVIATNTIGGGSDSAASLDGILVANYDTTDTIPAVATITANTIDGTDAGIEVAHGKTPGGPEPTATITNNAIAGNTQGIENITTSAVNAADNWYGCNGGPGATGCDTITGTGASDVTSAPYLKLALSALPSSIAPGASSTVVASIRQDSAGNSFPSGTFPSAIPLTFATTAGNLATSETLEDGEALTTLTGTPLGTATVTGKLDSQSATATVTTANAVSTTSSVAPTTVTVTVPAAVPPLISFLSSGALSLLASNPGSMLSVTCVDGCSGSVAASITLRERHGKHQTLRLATSPLTIAANGSSLYAVALTSAQRKALKKALAAALTLSVTATDDSTGKTVTGSKTFALTRS
jgi:hypothetical protein